MARASRPAALLLPLIVLLAGCQGDEGDELSFDVVTACARVRQPTEEVFRNADELRVFWSRHETRGDPPTVDFSRMMLAARFDGSGSACAGFSIEEVEMEDGRVEISAVRHTSPDPCIAVVAYPQVFVAIERTDAPVSWQISDRSAAPPAGSQSCM